MTVVRSVQGLYAIDWYTDFVPWIQWRAWRISELHQRFHPQKITMPLADPPIIADGVAVVLKHIEALRQEIRDEKGGSRAHWTPLSPDPKPWRPWPAEVCRDVLASELARRNIDGHNFLQAPNYSCDPVLVVRQCRQRMATKARRTPFLEAAQ